MRSNAGSKESAVLNGRWTNLGGRFNHLLKGQRRLRRSSPAVPGMIMSSRGFKDGELGQGEGMGTVFTQRRGTSGKKAAGGKGLKKW